MRSTESNKHTAGLRPLEVVGEIFQSASDREYPDGSTQRRSVIPFWLTAVACLVLCCIGTGCQSPAEWGAYSEQFAQYDSGNANYPVYRFQEGDVVSVTFQYSTNFNTTQKISLDGTLTLEDVGGIKAIGKTSQELQKDLEGLYGNKTKGDQITVKAIATAAAVYVVGAVLKPGKIQMDRPLTVVEAIMEAGGLDPYRAKLSDISVLRIQNGRQTVYHMSLKNMFDSKNEIPFYLKPYDIVRIPTKTFNL